MKDIPVYEIHLPTYNVETEPEHETIGTEVDDFIKKHFAGEHIAIRCIGVYEHPGKTIDEMVEIIKILGHDRYDPARPGDRYENNENRKIDIFALDFHIDEDSKIFGQFTWPFYHWHKKKLGIPVRIDLMIVYDPTQLQQIRFTYVGREHEGERSDGFVFTHPDNKAAAVKAIIKIL